MAQFDPRRQPLRFAPHLLTACAAVAVAGLIWKVYAPAHAAAPAVDLPPLDPAAVSALEAKAFAVAETRPGLAPPENVEVKVRPGESIEQAVRRVGVSPDDAAAAAGALARALGGAPVRAFDAAVARPREGRGGSARLIGLTLRTGPATTLTVSRSFDGAMKLRELEEEVTSEIKVAHGLVNDSLRESATAVGATPVVVNRFVKLYAHKLDFNRDVKSGDRFTMVFERDVTESGRTIKIGDLMYAEIEARGKPSRLYRFERNGKAEYFDETGKNIRGFLLRTPVDGARMSSGFGMRRHPILGYAKMHQGIDFAAGSGTPILAAGDGVVIEARRWGGYGNWVRIRHSGGWETGYAHLSRYGKGIKAGQRVSQGQVIGYVGSTGRSTGPHLHHEVWFKGKRVNPKGAKVPQGTILTGGELVAFKAQKAKIDALVRKGVQETHMASADKAGLRDAG
ncbi:MAG TPA: M23 family metallopeptidase [Caulobacteraceae bacterium]|nr:M23 family metallopeptidase [Caulobacteraceae bacterium]